MYVTKSPLLTACSGTVFRTNGRSVEAAAITDDCHWRRSRATGIPVAAASPRQTPYPGRHPAPAAPRARRRAGCTGAARTDAAPCFSMPPVVAVAPATPPAGPRRARGRRRTPPPGRRRWAGVPASSGSAASGCRRAPTTAAAATAASAAAAEAAAAGCCKRVYRTVFFHSRCFLACPGVGSNESGWTGRYGAIMAASRPAIVRLVQETVAIYCCLPNFGRCCRCQEG